MPLTGMIHELYMAMIARGQGEIDNSAIIDLLASLSGYSDWNNSTSG